MRVEKALIQMQCSDPVRVEHQGRCSARSSGPRLIPYEPIDGPKQGEVGYVHGDGEVDASCPRRPRHLQIGEVIVCYHDHASTAIQPHDLESRRAAWVGGDEVRPMDGDFYGGWITPELVGPFKGAPGTRHW